MYTSPLRISRLYSEGRGCGVREDDNSGAGVPGLYECFPASVDFILTPPFWFLLLVFLFQILFFGSSVSRSPLAVSPVRFFPSKVLIKSSSPFSTSSSPSCCFFPISPPDSPQSASKTRTERSHSGQSTLVLRYQNGNKDPLLVCLLEFFPKRKKQNPSISSRGVSVLSRFLLVR